MHIKAVMLLICLEVLGEGFFCFPERDWDIKCRSEFKHVFLNRRCFYYATLKALHGFQ